MTELTREQIEVYKAGIHAVPAAWGDIVCDMALRTHDAEQRAQRAEGLARYWRHWAGNYAGQAQRAEAHVERLQDAASGVINAVDELQQAFPEQGATPPPEGGAKCWRCNGKGESPNCPACDAENLDAPASSQQAHGDSLADAYEALEQLQEGCESQEAEMFGNVGGAKDLANKVRRHLTASGVPYEVKQLPEQWRNKVEGYRSAGNTAGAGMLEDHADELERALATAPAVPDYDYEKMARYFVHYLPDELTPERGSSLHPYMDALKKAIAAALSQHEQGE